MDKKRKVIIIGDSLFAEVAYEYFSRDSEYQVVAFSVEAAFLKRETLFGLPVVAFESLEEIFHPEAHHFYVAIVYTQMNALRTRLYQLAKTKGFAPASYVSPRAFVWENCSVGEHCFIFENNVVQPFVRIGNNVVLWSGNHIGHHSVIHDNVFVSSHVVISGSCEVGESCFIGVNSTFADCTKSGKNCLFGAGSLVLGDVSDNQKVIGIWKKSPEAQGKNS